MNRSLADGNFDDNARVLSINQDRTRRVHRAGAFASSVTRACTPRHKQDRNRGVTSAGSSTSTKMFIDFLGRFVTGAVAVVATASNAAVTILKELDADMQWRESWATTGATDESDDEAESGNETTFRMVAG